MCQQNIRSRYIIVSQQFRAAIFFYIFLFHKNLRVRAITHNLTKVYGEKFKEI